MRPLNSPADAGLVLVTSIKPSMYIGRLPPLREPAQLELRVSSAATVPAGKSRKESRPHQRMRKVRITVEEKKGSTGNKEPTFHGSARDTGAFGSFLNRWAGAEKSSEGSPLLVNGAKQDNYPYLIQQKAGNLFEMIDQTRQDHFTCGRGQAQDSQQEGRDDVGECSNFVALNAQDATPIGMPANSASAVARQATDLPTEATDAGEENKFLQRMLASIGMEKGRFHEAIKTIGAKQLFQDSAGLVGNVLSFYATKSEAVDENKEETQSTEKTEKMDEAISKTCAPIEATDELNVGSGLQDYFSTCMAVNLPIVETVVSVDDMVVDERKRSTTFQSQMTSTKDTMMRYTSIFSFDRPSDAAQLTVLRLAGISLSYVGEANDDGIFVDRGAV